MQWAESADTSSLNTQKAWSAERPEVQPAHPFPALKENSSCSSSSGSSNSSRGSSSSATNQPLPFLHPPKAVVVIDIVLVVEVVVVEVEVQLATPSLP